MDAAGGRGMWAEVAEAFEPSGVAVRCYCARRNAPLMCSTVQIDGTHAIARFEFNYISRIALISIIIPGRSTIHTGHIVPVLYI